MLGFAWDFVNECDNVDQKTETSGKIVDRTI